MANEFINLHVHTAIGSILDSIIKIPDLVKFAVDNNQKAIAITDHGYMSGFVDFVKECKAYGVKPIIGEEAYEVDDAFERADTKDYKQPRYHLILLAKNKDGLQNLFKISSWAATEGFYKKPLIEIKRIKENGWGKGIIASSACMIGRISKYLELGKEKEAEEFYKLMCETFDDFYLEIQSHPNEYQMQLNNNILKFAEKMKTDKIIITTDAHMVKEEDLEVHSVFVRIGEAREVGETYNGCYLQSYDKVKEICSNFDIDQKKIELAIQNTVKIADEIENIDIGLNNDNQMPIIDIPKEFSNSNEYVEHLIWEGFEERFKDMSEEKREERKQRLLKEIPVIEELGYSDYFIMLQMLTNACKARQIPLGYSRGSGGNCLCLYCLGVTQIDSCRWDLQFERFANLRKEKYGRLRSDFLKFSEKHIEEKDELLNLYYNQKLSVKQIAELKGYKEGTLKECFRDWNYISRNNSERHKKYFCNENYFNKIDSEHKAYWLGYIAADGTLFEKTKSEHSQRLQLHLAREDEELLYKFKKDIEATYPIKQYKNYCKYKKESWIGQPTSRIIIPSEKIFNDLMKYGITPRKSLTIVFPNELKDNQYINAFIRGYFDGDGCISENKSTSKNREHNYRVTIKGTQSMLYNFRTISGVEGIIKASGKHVDFRNKELVIAKHTEMKKFLNYIYNNSTIHLQRKYERYLLILKNY